MNNNKVYLFTASSVAGMNFLFFNSTANLVETVTGTLNTSGVWEATIPANLPVGNYTVVGTFGAKTFGKEDVNWDGVNITLAPQVIAKAVREELNIEMTKLISLQNGLTTNQATMLLELFLLMGLDPSKPLVVTKTQRYVGDGSIIRQTLVDTGTSTTAIRVP
jgi:hypothetical protein